MLKMEKVDWLMIILYIVGLIDNNLAYWISLCPFVVSSVYGGAEDSKYCT